MSNNRRPARLQLTRLQHVRLQLVVPAAAALAVLTACSAQQLQTAATVQSDIQLGLTLVCASPAGASPQVAALCVAGVPAAGALTTALSNPAVQAEILSLSAKLKNRS